jgi:ABC-type sugar transport system ATPase subunit
MPHGSTTRPEETATPAIRVRRLSKAFVGTQALEDVSIDFRRGKITALLGQNGSGKSTLIKSLAGVYSPDAGSLEVGGHAVRLPLTPSDSHAAGLRFVHQEPALVAGLSVSDNLCFTRGFEARGVLGRVRRRDQRERSVRALRRVGIDIPPDTPVSRLAPAERMLVAIARAFDVPAEQDQHRVLILDEPTAALGAESVDRVVETLVNVREAGGTVIYVSHRIDEVLRLADHVVVLRDGAVVADQELGSLSADDLARIIVGRAVDQAPAATRSRSEAPVLEARGLRGRRLRGVDLTLHRGEILGVAGLLGCGRSELARILAGAQSPDGGEIHIEGRTVAFADPRAALDAGIGYVPPDRRDHGCLLDFSLRENVTLTDLRPYWARGILRKHREHSDVAALMEQFDIRPRLPERPIRNFSGGNQQKAVIAKFARLEPKVLILDEPTQGVDIGGKQDILGVLRAFAAAGGCVLLASSDFDEIASTCDRVLVLSRGRQLGLYDVNSIDEERVTVLSSEAVEPTHSAA